MKNIYVLRFLVTLLMFVYGIFANITLYTMIHKEHVIGFWFSLFALIFMFSTLKIFDKWSEMERDLKIKEKFKKERDEI